MFSIEGKVAIVTGGASGIGFSVAKELLHNGAKGVTIADVNEKNGNEVVLALEKQFGKGKAIFVKIDVTRKKEFEVAFTQTLEKFKNIDILINNAGILDEWNWEKEVDVNVKGVVNGMILGLENYLKQHKQGSEAVILNSSSISALQPIHWLPIYAAAKSAIISLTTSWGCNIHYERTKVRVMAICPGTTDTPIIENLHRVLTSDYNPSEEILLKEYNFKNKQHPDYVAKEAVKIIKYGSNGSIWAIEKNLPAYEYHYADRNMFKDHVLKDH